MNGGYVLNFSDRTMGEFFRDDIGIDIYNKKYKYASGSKTNCIRCFLLKTEVWKGGCINWDWGGNPPL